MLHIYTRNCLASPAPLPHTCAVTLCPLAKLGFHTETDTYTQTRTHPGKTAKTLTGQKS